MKTNRKMLSVLTVALVPMVSFATETSLKLQAAEIKAAIAAPKVGAYRSVNRDLLNSIFESQVSCQDTRSQKGKTYTSRLAIDADLKSNMKRGKFASFNDNIAVDFSQSGWGEKVKYVVTKKNAQHKVVTVQEGWLEPGKEAGTLGEKVPWLKCGVSGFSNEKSLSKRSWETEAASVGLGLLATYMQKKMTERAMSPDPAPHESLKILEQNRSYPAADAQTAD